MYDFSSCENIQFFPPGSILPNYDNDKRDKKKHEKYGNRRSGLHNSSSSIQYIVVVVVVVYNRVKKCIFARVCNDIAMTLQHSFITPFSKVPNETGVRK